MKTEIIEAEKEYDIKFPCLMRRDGLVILVVGKSENRSECMGTVVKVSQNGFYYLGQYREDWVFGMLTPFYGSICLSND